MKKISFVADYKLNENEISKTKNTEFIGEPLYFFDEVTSTFDEIAKHPRTEGLTVVAKSQTSGRGRLGRSWCSGKGGIYFSFNLTPDATPEEATFATLTCAVGVVKALRRYGDCAIKWPNDIVMNGKKISGILTTMAASENKLEYIYVGIGINANCDNFDSDLPYASSIKIETGETKNENEIFVSVLQSIEQVYKTYSKEDVLKEYCDNCATIGSMVAIHYTDGRPDFEGKCTGITDGGSLVVKSNEKTVTVSSGEVSVRGLYGYL